MDIAFDQALLSVVGGSATPGSCPQPDFVVANSVSGGTLNYAAAQLNPTPPCNGGTVATIELMCAAGLTSSGTAQVTIESSILSDPDGQPIAHTTQNAAILCQVGCTTDCLELTVEKTGYGTGTVAGNPLGIDCGSDCSALYSSGTPVTLEATRDLGSTFEGWSGDCSGTSPTAQVTVDADKSCTAAFATCVAFKDVSDRVVVDRQYFETCTLLQAGNFVIEGSGGDATFVAGEQITLQSGFQVKSGGIFSAVIDPSLSP